MEAGEAAEGPNQRLDVKIGTLWLQDESPGGSHGLVASLQGGSVLRSFY